MDLHGVLQDSFYLDSNLQHANTAHRRKRLLYYTLNRGISRDKKRDGVGGSRGYVGRNRAGKGSADKDTGGSWLLGNSSVNSHIKKCP
jgi:hypothetical protein